MKHNEIISDVLKGIISGASESMKDRMKKKKGKDIEPEVITIEIEEIEPIDVIEVEEVDLDKDDKKPESIMDRLKEKVKKRREKQKGV